MEKNVITPTDFVEEFYLLKQSYLTSISDSTHSASYVNSLLQQMNLSSGQRVALMKLLDVAVTDILYTVLLGLDGAAQIGVKQVNYMVSDEQGNIVVCGDGEVEALAYKRFHDAALPQ